MEGVNGITGHSEEGLSNAVMKPSKARSNFVCGGARSILLIRPLDRPQASWTQLYTYIHINIDTYTHIYIYIYVFVIVYIYKDIYIYR